MLSDFVDPDAKIRFWARVLPWVLMACAVTISLAFSYSLIK